MNKREEDRLIELAFGELDSTEESILAHRVHSDEEFEAFVSEWEELRDDLKDLRDIPEMQFSKERLRDAILGQGLKPARTLSWWNYAWAPLAACLAIAVIVPILKNRNSQPVLVMSDSSSKEPSKNDLFASGNRPKIDLSIPKPTNISTAPRLTSTNPIESAVSTSTVSRRKAGESNTLVASIRRSHRATGSSFGNQPSGILMSRGSKMTLSKLPGDLSTAPSTAMVMPDTSGPMGNDVAVTESNPVVLLDESAKNLETGASNATELGSVSNVVVGG